MIAMPEVDLTCTLTDGEIAVNNLKSALRRAWSRFWRDPLQTGIAECIVEQEQLTAQFLGDYGALDRLEALVHHLDSLDVDSPRSALIHARVASMVHRFADAKRYLAMVSSERELAANVHRLSLSIDQACGTRLDLVLEERGRIAAESGRLEDLVPLAALYADLGEFDEADQTYQRALREYRGTCPFGVAWVCLQLGVLWGELAPEVQLTQAEGWYQKAIQCLPAYVKAHVHLAEIYLGRGLPALAEETLIPVIPSGDPEVYWRLADVLIALGRFAEAEKPMQAARSGFEALLKTHLPAFADHVVEFYLGSGNSPQRALELAVLNLGNRPTVRAFEQAYKAGVAVGEPEELTKTLAAARNRWGAEKAFRVSPLAEIHGRQSASEA